MPPPRHNGVGGFCRRYGFLDKPRRIRFRILDEGVRLMPTESGGDISLAQTAFAALNIPLSKVFITENEVNFLAFPDVPGSMAIFGAGYGFDNLSGTGRLRENLWGDRVRLEQERNGFDFLKDALRGLGSAGSAGMQVFTKWESRYHIVNKFHDGRLVPFYTSFMVPRTLALSVEHVKQMFPGYHYLNLEALDIRALAEEDPCRLITSYIDRGIIIDEAQRVPALFSYLQTIVDETGEMGKVVLTGSQHFLLLESISQSLAGRVMVLHLLPFTLSELPDAKKESLNRVLFRGMYPPLHDRNIDAAIFYPTYIQTYVERDVRLIRNIGDLSVFTRFLRLCAGRVGSLLNMSSLAVEAGIDHKTVRSWISILEASFIVYLLHPYHRNYNKRIVKQPKIYFYDTGLLCSLLGLADKNQLSTHYLRGGIFENFILSEYRKMKMHRAGRPDMYFWRDNTGTEVDLILEHGNGFSAVEIKSGTTLREEYTRSLMKFAAYSGCPPEQRYVIYGGDTSYSGTHARIKSWRDIVDLFDTP